VTLRSGGNELEVNGEARPVSDVDEYPALYARMAGW
jgi:hypothetical protein